MARRLVLVCGVTGVLPGLAEPVERVPSRPGKAEIDPLLSAYPGTPLIVAGNDADLAAVVVRLLRKEKLAGTPVGFVPTTAGSEVARRWGLPTDPARALEIALTAEPEPVPLVRDDAGGVLVGKGTIESVRGVAYCDDFVALRGSVRSIEVWPDETAGLAVRVRKGLLKGAETVTSRAFQIGCTPTRPRCDGIEHPRPVERWTWYRHTEDLRLVR